MPQGQDASLGPGLVLSYYADVSSTMGLVHVKIYGNAHKQIKRARKSDSWECKAAQH